MARLGVYADDGGAPGTLLLDAGEATVTNGWVSIDGLSLSVIENEYYWSGFVLNSINGVRYLTDTPEYYHYFNYNYCGALPGQYPLTGATPITTHFVMQATITTG